MSQSLRSGRQRCQFRWHTMVVETGAQLSLEACDSPQHGLLQKHSLKPSSMHGIKRGLNIYRDPLSVSDPNIKSWWTIVPSPDTPRPAMCSFAAWILERHSQASSPASSQTQHGLSLLSASRSHLCSKVGWSALCSIGWQMRQTAGR